MGVLKFGFNLYNDFKFEILALKFVEIIFDSWPFSVVASFNFLLRTMKEALQVFFFLIMKTITSCVYICKATLTDFTISVVQLLQHKFGMFSLPIQPDDTSFNLSF